MSQGRTIVFVHGKAGREPTDGWLGPLNTGLSALGYPRIGASGDRIIEADYLPALLAGADGETPPVLAERAPTRQRKQEWADYLLRRETLAETIERSRNDPRGLNAAVFSDTPLPDQVAGTMRAVSAYRGSRASRHAAWRSVLESLPESGSVVVIAHSLGSILMLDLLRRLPPELRIDLLVTIGSPMGVKSLRAHHGGIDDAEGFPADRVLAWANVFDPGDVITVGRGASPYFAAALDAPVHTGGSHSLRAYMSHPVVAAAVGLAMFGPAAVATDEPVPARLVDPRWDPLLLRFAYTQQLWSTCRTDRWGFRRSVDTARRVQARRNVENVAQQYQSLMRRADSLDGDARRDYVRQLERAAVNPVHAPSEDDLLIHASDLVRSRFSDVQLVVAAVEFLLSPPLPPFDLDVADEHTTKALGALLQRVQRSSAGPSGDQFAELVTLAVKEARDALSETGFPWGPVLITTGIGLLALTGVGLLVAAPAGLAGAAAIASTMATFGPGGMVGGIATLAALTGAATAITGVGVAVELAPGDPGYEQVREAMASQLADLPAAQLRTSVAGMLAVLSAQRRLDLLSDARSIEDLLLRTQAIVLHERALHVDVAPGRPGTKGWHAKARILARALDRLSDSGAEMGVPVVERAAVRAAIDADPSS
jgi:hypothetical protein